MFFLYTSTLNSIKYIFFGVIKKFIIIEVMKAFAPLIISGASGSGKSTLITDLLLKYSTLFNLTISHTTRSIREGEITNFHYYYIHENEFMTLISNDKFLEYEKVHNNYYGTSKAEIERIKNLKKIAILDIDIKGNIYNKKLLLKSKQISGF